MKDQKRRIVTGGIVILALLGILLGFATAHQLARKSASLRAEAVLMDSAREQAATLTATLNGQFEVLHTVSEALNGMPDTDMDTMNQQLTKIAESTSMSKLRLIRLDGSLIDSLDTDVDFSDRAYFQKALAGEDAMEYVQGRLTGEDVLILSAPRRRDGQIIGVISGLLYRAQLQKMIVSQAYRGAGMSCLIDASGRILADIQAEPALPGAFSVFDALGDTALQGSVSSQELRLCLRDGQPVFLRFHRDADTRLAVLYPLDSQRLPQNDWFVLNIVQGDELQTEIVDNLQNTLLSTGIFAAFVLMALTLFLLLERDHRSKMRRDADDLHQREEQFRIVARQSGRFVCRYDIPSDTLYPDEDPMDPLGGHLPYANAARHDIASGRVTEECAEDYLAFFQQIAKGHSPVQGDFLLRQTDGARRWYRYTSTTLFDKAGNPLTAILSYFDYTELRERELAYLKWQQEITGMSYENAFLYEWNLTQDACEGMRGALPGWQREQPKTTFDAWAAFFADNGVSPEDRAVYLAFMNRERLIGMFYNAMDHDALDYRDHSPEGESRWRRLSVQMAPYPETQAVKAYVVSRDVDEEKRAELALIDRSQRDSLTGALNREALIRWLEERIAHDPTATHAVMMMDVDHFKQINDRLGHEAGDQALISLVARTRSVLRASDCIGRMGGDEFLVCLSGMPEKASVEKKAALLCSLLRKPLDGGFSITVSIGVALYPQDGEGFGDLYRHADEALYQAKSLGRDGYAFYHP